jgi:hypothetical protein
MKRSVSARLRGRTPSLAGGRAIRRYSAKAVLPLPEDLRANATINVYDAKGDRKILRTGNNMVECMPKDPETGFMRCYNKITAARRDLEAKLKARKMPDQEITAAMPRHSGRSHHDPD